MLKSAIQKLIEYAVVLFVVSVLIFFLIHLFSPTDPVSVIIGGKGGTPEQIQAATLDRVLNEPIWRQYLYWVAGIFHGDWGISYKYHTPVLESIADRAPVTLGLVLGASLLSIAIAIPLGVVSAVKKGKRWTRTLSILSLVIAAVPSRFAEYAFDSGVIKTGTWLSDYRRLYRSKRLSGKNVLAMYCSGMFQDHHYTEVTRQGMVEQMQMPYIMNVESKGMPQKNVVWKHSLKNAVIPVISILSIQIGAMIVGAVLVESVFSLSGVGSLLIDSIKSSDFPVVQAVILMLVMVFLITGAVADILYTVIDPRIRAGRNRR